MLKTSDFDYLLPADCIAQYPREKRAQARLLVLQRSTGAIAHRRFSDLVDYLRPEDCLVFNETKVIPARLLGRRPTGGQVEVFLLQQAGPQRWRVLLRPARKLPVGTVIPFGQDNAGQSVLEAEVVERGEGGRGVVVFHYQGDFWRLLEQWGQVPLPPYIHRPPERTDTTHYQTVYARVPGAVAAPTAGLHFSRSLLTRLQRKGVKQVPVLLHVGPGTFQPVQTEKVNTHRLESEYYRIDPEAAHCINTTRRRGGRIVAVGTTTVRVLETVAVEQQGDSEATVRVEAGAGWTDKFIYPPYRFRAVEMLITNFHLPRSTLLMLVAAFAGREQILAAYRKAIAAGYRFYSYGDAMLLL